jgi:uncharacterized protein YfaS (alpha-2-macroglobulin family)
MALLNKSWRLSARLCVALAGLVFSGITSAQGKTIKGEATVVAVNTTTKIGTFAVESKSRTSNKTVVTNYTYPINTDAVFLRLPTGNRKTAAQISDLKAGQRVSVKVMVIPSITTPGYVTEVIIPAERKKRR